MKRILAAVDDSLPALAAAAAAIDLATTGRAALHFVSVTEPGRDVTRALRHVADLAERAGVPAETTATDGGHAFEVLLRTARTWEADVIVMGRSDRRRPGVPYLGSQTEHLLEFTEIPVLVVPHVRT